MEYIDATERIYRELARPKPVDVKLAPAADVKPVTLTRADVDAIISRKRTATPDELQDIISHAKDFDLTSGERNLLGVELSVAIAQRIRGLDGRRQDHPSDRLIHDLGYAQTPFGLLYDRASFQRQMQSGSKAIAECRRHTPPHCECWRETREALWYIRSLFQERSPEAFAAMQVWESLEDLEFSSRPERREAQNHLQ
jgi:hypothetical protein